MMVLIYMLNSFLMSILLWQKNCLKKFVKKIVTSFPKKITRYCFRTLIPPWKPKVISEQDMRYFSPVSRRTRNWNTSEEFSGWDENF